MGNFQNENEELVSSDDSIIAKALKVSGWILLMIFAIAGIVFFLINRPEGKGEVTRTDISAPVQKEENVSSTPIVTFEDVTQSSGIDFIHNNGATGEKMLPESLGGGVAFLDFDNDGDQDLLFINSTWWKWDLEKNTELEPTTSQLYRNDTPQNGPVKFTNVTLGSGLDQPLFGMGLALGDYDNDGFVDIFISAVGENVLFRNLGNGKFTDVTQSSGTSGGEDEWSTAATFFDYDNDGLLDLFVGNYVKWNREIDLKVNFTIDGSTRAYGPPTDFEGRFARLYKNKGNGSFEDVSELANINVRNNATMAPVSKTLGVAPFDFNDDGWVDIMVANDTVRNLLFINKGDGTFKERGSLCGVAFDSNGNTRGAMGIDVANYRNSNDVGIAIGNFTNEMTSLYVTQGQSLLFADEAIAEGIGPTSRLSLKFGIFFWDYDLDGWQDILSVNGHLDEDVVKVQKSQTYKQPALLYWNDQGNGFVNIQKENARGDIFTPIVGRGCAYADIDKDGDLDIVFTQINGAPMLLKNNISGENKSLRIKLIGSGKVNKDAIGSKVILYQGSDTIQKRFVTPTRGYLSQSESIMTFGLGQSPSFDRIEIIWAGGETQLIQLDDLEIGGGAINSIVHSQN